MQERAKQYDSPRGERSMGKAVAAFNCVTGNKMTEAEGWLLLQLLKDVRQWSTPNTAHVDSLQDCIAYAALKAECIIEQNHIPDDMKTVYSDTGYTEQDMQAASLVHDAAPSLGSCDNCSKSQADGWALMCVDCAIKAFSNENKQTQADSETRKGNDALAPALVELCGYTTIHSDDGWHVHVGKGCPLDDQDTLIHIKVASGEHYDAMPAEYANFLLPIGHKERITHWRYAKENQLD